MNLRRWLTVGIGVKRWVVVAFVGLLLLAVGVAHALRQVTADLSPGDPVGVIASVLTLQFLPFQLRGLVAGGLGIALFLFGAYRLIRALVDPFALWDRDQPMVEVIYQKRFLARGPRVVAIGGGTGLSTLLRGLKEHTSNLTAVVTVADDGGSSGILRAELGIPAVGDIRNCLVALADAEPMMGRLLQYRFPGAAARLTGIDVTGAIGSSREGTTGVTGADGRSGATGEAATDATGEGGTGGLRGHALGNLLTAAMIDLEGGDFEQAVREMNRVLAVRGRVVPATGTAINLHARLVDGTELAGQSRITRTDRVDRVWVTPADVPATADAVRAIKDAQLIVIGPGSLFTSLLPALLVPGIREAIAASGALVVFVANVATQAGETEGFDLADHVDALARHGAGHLPHIVLANSRLDARAPAGWQAAPVGLRWPPMEAEPPRLMLEDVVDPANAHHHDPGRLAAAILHAWEREGGHRRRPSDARAVRTA